ncbi:hypothetical protein, partial [Dermacoccus nishinomiyaensis]|uniref:hypothetical protein n=1 Tax=Dermacoccus nishinomiyaensis TaxID=1274 RepID=UPI001C9300CC
MDMSGRGEDGMWGVGGEVVREMEDGGGEVVVVDEGEDVEVRGVGVEGDEGGMEVDVASGVWGMAGERDEDASDGGGGRVGEG